ncbi:MAG: hypothetical protein INQ03_05420 [Candidatus Heimdallarchaeota archaeon]|nr:hypothetical protein [Candidatus Heimdallarchaeota archaeon]
MSGGILDYSSWKRAFTPAFRAFAYFTMIYLIQFVILYLIIWILSAFVPEEIVSFLYSTISVVIIVFAFFLAFFKVLDEDRPGDIQLNMV